MKMTFTRAAATVLRTLRYAHVRGRQAFNYQGVVSGWGKGGAGLPNFSSRLYHEVVLLKKAIGDYQARRSLEIGCGYGRLTPWIAESSKEHFAVEPEAKLLSDAKRLYPNVRFYKYRAQDLPFPDGFFDLCVSWTVLQHVSPRLLDGAISELKRVCFPRSIIILCEAVGNATKLSRRVWRRPFQEWMKLLSPWKLVRFTPRRIEETNKKAAGLVMRFERGHF